MLGLYGVLDSIASVRRQDVVDREENGASNKRALASYSENTGHGTILVLLDARQRLGLGEANTGPVFQLKRNTHTSQLTNMQHLRHQTKETK